MSRIYKLKANLPTFWAGDWCELSDSGKLHWLGSPDPEANRTERKLHLREDVIMYRKETIQEFDLLSEESAWFEPVSDEEVGKYFPVQNCTYYYIDSLGKVNKKRYYDYCYEDSERARIGNIFITREDALDIAERMKGLFMLGKVANSAASNKDGSVVVSGQMGNSQKAREFCQIFMGINNENKSRSDNQD